MNVLIFSTYHFYLNQQTLQIKVILLPLQHALKKNDIAELEMESLFMHQKHI